MNHSTRDGKYEEGIYESMRFGSPYTPGAGAVPTYLAGRDELLENAEKSINALVKGLARYDTYYNEANSLGVGNQMKEARAQIIQAFNDTFKISESEAVSLVAMSDNNFTQYYRKIEAYGKAR